MAWILARLDRDLETYPVKRVNNCQSHHATSDSALEEECMNSMLREYKMFNRKAEEFEAEAEQDLEDKLLQLLSHQPKHPLAYAPLPFPPSIELSVVAAYPRQ
jgi:hypothetical protein